MSKFKFHHNFHVKVTVCLSVCLSSKTILLEIFVRWPLHLEETPILSVPFSFNALVLSKLSKQPCTAQFMFQLRNSTSTYVLVGEGGGWREFLYTACVCVCVCVCVF